MSGKIRNVLRRILASWRNRGPSLEATEEKLGKIEARLTDINVKLDAMTPIPRLTSIIEERSRTLVYQSSLANFAIAHEIDQISKWYREAAASNLSVTENAAISRAGTIAIETIRPIAYESNDHITPDSTAEGVTRPTHFVRHCIDVLGSQILAVDIGTGAAGLVYEMLMNDVVALGIDGSDYCRRNRIGYWPVIPGALHTCDVTYPFTARGSDGQPVKFELITLWEVFEHIAEASLPGMLGNIASHLAPGGYCLGSISLLEYNAPDGTPYHVTRQPKSWWRERFTENGLEMIDDHPFNERLFCRGNGPRFQDMHNYLQDPEAGFHFVARLTQ